MTDASYSTCLELCRMSCSNQAQHNANMIDRSRRVALRGAACIHPCHAQGEMLSKLHTSFAVGSQLSAPRAVHASTCAVYTAPAPSSQKFLLRHRRARWVTHRGRFCFCFALHGTVGSGCPQEPAQPSPHPCRGHCHSTCSYVALSKFQPMRHARLPEVCMTMSAVRHAEVKLVWRWRSRDGQSSWREGASYSLAARRTCFI